MCWSYNWPYGTKYLSVMPTNLYGLGDNYHLDNSHVIPALLRKFHEAKTAGKQEVVIWGTGENITIKHLVDLIGGIVGYSGKIVFDASKPDGTSRKLMDVSLLSSNGWKAGVTLEEELRLAYLDFLEWEK